MRQKDSKVGARRVLVFALLAVITLSVSSLFFLSMGKFTAGALSVPLDDSFIYFQYARSVAEGRGFAYSPGTAPSTGATSYLYTLVLALGYWLGGRGNSIILFSFVLGSCFLFASALLIERIVRSFSNEIASTGAAVLFLLNGRMLWSYLSGMEGGLFGTSILLTLLLFLKERESGRFYGTAVAAAVMGFSRPEGFFLALPVALLIVRDSAQRGRPERILLTVLSLSGAVQFGLNWLLTGSPASTGAQAKSVFYTQEPDMWRLYMRRFFELPDDVFRLFLGNFGSWSFGAFWAKVGRLFLTVGFLFAWIFFALTRRLKDSLTLLLISWIVLSLFLSLVPWAWNVHLNRYQAHFFPVFLVISSIGFGSLVRLASGRTRYLVGFILVVVFAATAYSFLGGAKRMALQYAHNCENIFHQQVRVGRWVNLNTPSDVLIGLNDAGAIAYVGERNVFDFVGLVTQGQALDWRSGIGSIVESLERLPREKLPGLLAIYPNWLPFFVTSGIAEVELLRAHLDFNTICGGTDKVVYLPDWSLLGSGQSPPHIDATSNLRIVDQLDVADLESERGHRYSPGGKWRSQARILAGSADEKILDGGRMIFEGETMRVRCTPHQDLTILTRLDEQSPALRFYIDGTLVGSGRLVDSARSENLREAGWTYAVLTVPSKFVRAEKVGITVKMDAGNEAVAYGSYHYWFLQ